MKVILNQDVPTLGEEGDICEVKPGYARNYLLPRNLVLLDNRANRALIESRRRDIEDRKERKRLEARSTRERIEADTMVVEMPAGENGKLFGSLSSAGIAERLEKLGVDVQRRHIDVPEKTIKTVGTYSVRVRLYGEEEATLTVSVQPSGKKQDAPASESSKESEPLQTEADATPAAAEEKAPAPEKDGGVESAENEASPEQ